MSDSSHPLSIPFPSSPFSTQTTYQVDKTGNLIPIRLTLDQTHFTLKIEELEFTAPQTPLTPQTPLLSSGTATPPTPATPGSSIRRKISLTPTLSSNPSTPSTPSIGGKFAAFSFRKSFIHRLSKRSSSSGYSSSSSTYPPTISVKSTELLHLPEVAEVRFSDFDPKTCVLSSEASKKLKPLTHGSRKMQAHKHKIIHVLFGKEFNLKAHKFVVQGTFEREQPQVVSEWVEQVRSLVTQSQEAGYFEKLDLWYTQQFDMVVAKAENYRLKIWKHFLHRSHHRMTTESLQRVYGNVQNIVQQSNPELCVGPLEKPEFSVIARYFVHCQASVSVIFESLGGDAELLHLLSTATDQEMETHETLAQFQTLFNDYFSYVQQQKENLSTVPELDTAPTYTKAIIRKFAERARQRETERVVSEKWLCSHYLLDYMYSPENSIWSPGSRSVSQDMSLPLSHYWIQSSHNTYLTGDQYSSHSSVEAYARVLRDGCRCIEIDLWNGPFNKPIVKHGRTLTTAVNLKDVLLTIKEHAFVTSPYPVIISLENHCSVPVQKVVAKYFQKIFGKMLVTAPGQKVSELPSPEQLKHKIILKGRKLPCLENLQNEPSQDKPEDEESQCDCLITGELWKSSETGKWTPCIFVLTNRKLFYIEKREDEIGKLPNHWKARTYRHSISMSSTDSFQDLHFDQLWYVGKISGGRKAAEAMLEKCGENGAFLVRESDAVQGGHTLCFYFKDDTAPQQEQSPTVYHCPIHRRGSEPFYSLKQNPEDHELFPSIYELIEHYKRSPLITTRCHLDHLTVAVPPSQTHEQEEWFYATMDRSGAERTLERLPINGAFLARYRTDDRREIAISFRFEHVIKHCHVKREGRYLTVSNKAFVKLEQLVENYSKYPFYKTMKLCHPVGRELWHQSQQSDCVQRVYACQEYLDSTVKTVKGTVRAIQSFNPVDPELLSFRKDDILINVIKEPGGWWSGTRKDAEGEDALISKQFPANFVENLEELENSPFGDFIEKGSWKLGSVAKVKPCNDKAVKEYGIKQYISFKYHDGTKKKLGASCSKRKVNEWVDLLNYVADKDVDGKRAFAAEKYKIASELSDLIYLASMNKKIGPEECVGNSETVNVCLTKSVEEVRGDRLFRSNAPFFVWYHTRALTRVYPRGFRLDSSNYSPERYWNFGSQMVALNFQTPDKPMQWNRGKFRQNGGCGYVLKPEFMRVTQPTFDPQGEWGSSETTLTLRIIGARHLTKPGTGQIYPLVEIEVVGVDADRYRVKTSAKDTGLNPHWNETVELRLRCPELALIQFTILDSAEMDKLFLGEATIPFPCIRRSGGYRSIQLNNEYGTPLLATLLVHATVDQQMPTFDKPPLLDSHNL